MTAIIVPVNFSQASTNAAQYALKLALDNNAELHLLHVIMIQPSITHAPLPDNLMEQMKDDARFSMAELAEDLRSAPGSEVPIHTHIEWGSVDHQVKELASRKHADIVVMGLSQESAQKVVYQSNAFSALKTLNVPLLIIPDNAAYKAWEHIALAYDFAHPVKELPLESITKLKYLKGAIIHVVYAKRKNEAEPGHAVMQDVRERLAGCEVRFHLVESESVDEGISEYAGHHEADLLVLLPKHHSFFEFHKSDSKRILRHLSVPMLSTPL